MANTLSLQVPNYYYGTARERTSHEENLNKISKRNIERGPILGIL